MMQTAAAVAADAAFPWVQLITGGGGVGALITALWMFLGHLTKVNERAQQASEKKSEAIAKVSTEFSATVKQVSTDVKQGLEELSKTQTLLLADSRAREDRLHSMLRDRAERQT